MEILVARDEAKNWIDWLEFVTAFPCGGRVMRSYLAFTIPWAALQIGVCNDLWAQQPQRSRRPIATPAGPPNSPVVSPDPFSRLRVELGEAAPIPTRNQSDVQTPPQDANLQGETPSAPLKLLKSEEVAFQSTKLTEMELPAVRWRRDFESTQRRAIETVVLGNGPERFAILSSLAGNAAPTVALVERLAGHLSQPNAVPAQATILIVRNPNPDGIANRTLTNSRGVDLNRNFPTSRFVANPGRGTGDKPGSEAETRAVMQILNQFNPSRVIHVVESRSSRGTVRTDDVPPRELLSTFDGAPFDGVYKNGSLADYVHQTMKKPVIEFELPTSATTAVEESTLIQLAVSLLDQTEHNARIQLQPAKLAGTGTARPTSQTTTDGLRGNVEYLPPPPDSGPMPVTSRYIELPPPPGAN